jgi:hypothetical protein
VAGVKDGMILAPRRCEVWPNQKPCCETPIRHSLAAPANMTHPGSLFAL